MGACLSYLTYEHDDRAKISKDFEQAAEDSRIQSGNSYSGEIGMLHGRIDWHDKLFESWNDAYEHLSDKHQKWDGPMAVSFKVVDSKEKLEKRVSEAKKLVNVAVEKEGKLCNDLIDQIINRKSEFVGCKKCKSKLSLKHLAPHIKPKFGYSQEPTCPLCGESLLSDTAKQRLAKAKVKVASAQEKVTEARKPKSSDKVSKGWIVGGWCSS